MKWYYDRKTHRYRDEKGRFLSKATVVGLRDAFIDKQMAAVDQIVGLPPDQFERAMRRVIKDTHIAEGLLGIGGRKNATQSFWGKLGRAIRTQYDFLRRFANEISKGRLSAKQIAFRARLYIRAATASFERGQLTAHDIQAYLPIIPGDGQTECSVNCRCTWQIRETKTEFILSWVLDPGCQHCRDCPELAREYAALRIAK